MRPADPLEIRARELCLAAGIDPDTRIEKIGSPRGMPAWCGFRDTAKAEQNIREASKAAEQFVNLRPQEEQYQKAPLTVFGEHDEGTLMQMRNCMSVGNVVGGVLCADGHLGFSQPIGGVIAYQDMVSVSGTGFDIACGHAAIKTDVTFGAVKDRIPMIIDEINKHVIFGLGGRGKKHVDAELFDDLEAWRSADAESLRTTAQSQLFSCGTSNHFLDLLYEVPSDPNAHFNPDEQPVWVANHFGSRGLGHQSATKYLKLAGAKDGLHAPPALLSAQS
jgi:tRNA-splicing ligase RtcB